MASLSAASFVRAAVQWNKVQEAADVVAEEKGKEEWVWEEAEGKERVGGSKTR